MVDREEEGVSIRRALLDLKVLTAPLLKFGK